MRILPLLLFALLLSGQVRTANFKEFGSPDAPLTLEAYTDYECPYCAAFFRDIVPPLMDQYVRTGKVRFIHRDFPLPQHQYSRLAARYANAAGEIGTYELAASQIFKTQDTWSKTGNIDAELAKVLPPGDMQKVRGLVKAAVRLDDSVLKDVAMGTNVDHVTGTPTVVIVSKGKREVIPNAALLPLSVWKSYLDVKVAKLTARD
jgi:protein-disulfide isomerase